MSSDHIVTRLRDIAAHCWCAEKSQGEPVGKPFFRCESCDDQLCAADEIERLRAEVAELQEGQLTNRWPLHKMLAAERELADKLARALRSVIHDKPTAHTDEVWLRIHKALEAHEEARRG